MEERIKNGPSGVGEAFTKDCNRLSSNRPMKVKMKTNITSVHKSNIDINHLEGRELQEESSAKEDGRCTSCTDNGVKMEHNVRE